MKVLDEEEERYISGRSIEEVLRTEGGETRLQRLTRFYRTKFERYRYRIALQLGSDEAMSKICRCSVSLGECPACEMMRLRKETDENKGENNNE